ncbi:hypothetical protein HK100_007634 [Physocladia obscura]|uniref:RZZ complex subunit KNTC1/ROD C-terminal domain-containing protein n=1 Tax=Physocladia obscura TaxID=109957 RepID=A0AAD5T6C1_9FUNG|nr:hypothetical protein HK100_007634 [Physocladia obscura]
MRTLKDDVKELYLSNGSIKPAAVTTSIILSHIAGLEMENSSCSSATLKALGNMRDLSKEFDIRICLQTYKNDENYRRVILNKFAKEVFKYGSETTQLSEVVFTRTELYRLAELLGFARSSLDGIIAEEAARNGDVKTALLLCKVCYFTSAKSFVSEELKQELFEKSPDSSCSGILRNIALLLTVYASENKEVFRDIKETKTNFRLTKWIMELCQKSLALCNESCLSDCLDEFKNYEIMHSIFTQCDSGDYGTLLSAANDTQTLNFQSISSIGGSSSSSLSQPMASLSSFPVNWSLSTKLSDRSLDLEVANIGDSFGGMLFEEHYHEGGLVLPTEKSMALATGFIMDLATAISRQVEADTNENTSFSMTSPVKVASKGNGKKNKGVSVAFEPIYSGEEVATYLKNNRVLIAALRMWHRTIELRLRMSGILKEIAPLTLESVEYVVDGHIRLVTTLAENIFSSRHIDQNLAFGCLLTLDMRDAFIVFKSGMSTTGKDYNRLLKFAVVGVACGLAWNQAGYQADCQTLAKNAKWWHQFSLLNIHVDTDAFNMSRMGEYQRKFVPIILEKTGLDVLTALEFSRAYGVEDDCVIFEYIKQLLEDVSKGNEYKYRVAGVIDDVSNKSVLTAILHETLASSSPYDYEKLIFICNQILRLDSVDIEARRSLIILEILSNYQRKHVPTEDEFNFLNKKLSVDEGLNLYPQSMRRLPFHSVLHFGWNVLENEINESSVQRLIALSTPLKLLPDQFYLAVLDNFVSRLEAQELMPFSEFKSFISKLHDIKKAIAVATQIAERFPPGLDRVAAFKMAEALAEKLMMGTLNSENQNEIAEIKSLHKSLSFALKAAEIEHLLKNHELNQYSRLLGDPKALMEELYKEKSEEALLSEGSFDLHTLVDKIGARHGIDVMKFRTILLQKLIFQDATISMEEKKLYLPSMRVQANNILNSSGERSLQLQLLYIARSVSVQDGIKFFRTAAYANTSKIQTLHRIRSLSLLFQLADVHEIEDAGKSYDEIRSYLQILLYLLDFEELRIVQSIKEFDDCDKEALARSLWLNHGTESKIRYLAGIIESVSVIPELSRIKSLPLLWSSVISQCLEEVAQKGDSGRFN